MFVEPHRFNADKLGPEFTNFKPRLAELRQQLFAESDDAKLAASD
jgi:hypothetical protein